VEVALLDLLAADHRLACSLLQDVAKVWRAEQAVVNDVFSPQQELLPWDLVDCFYDFA
jgi:hypothetical protein